jgi:hypothetical protein
MRIVLSTRTVLLQSKSYKPRIISTKDLHGIDEDDENALQLTTKKACDLIRADEETLTDQKRLPRH